MEYLKVRCVMFVGGPGEVKLTFKPSSSHAEREDRCLQHLQLWGFKPSLTRVFGCIGRCYIFQNEVLRMFKVHCFSVELDS